MFEIGTSLREARARRHLGYDQVEAETKIRAKYIRCLEEEDFGTLPSGTYVKGFLRTYADYLGLDGQLYVDEYNSRYGDEQFEEQIFRRRERPAPRRRESSNAVLVALAGIVAVAVLFFVAWKFGGSQAPSSELQTKVTPLQTTSVNPSLIANTRPHQHKVNRTTPAKPPAPKTVKMVISAGSEDAWVQVVRGARGAQVASKTITAGSFIGPVTNAKGFTIVQAPRYQAVQVKVNGKTYSLTPPGPWRVTATGVTSAASAH
jgi:cytoskeletal protein RodZ